MTLLELHRKTARLLEEWSEDTPVEVMESYNLTVRNDGVIVKGATYYGTPSDESVFVTPGDHNSDVDRVMILPANMVPIREVKKG